MAGIDVGGGGSKRPVNQEIPLIPFIDFLLCLVMFLLVTAVWSQMARLNANAQVPGPPRDEPLEKVEKPKTLHVEINPNNDEQFRLQWKEGSTVTNTIDVERKKVMVSGSEDYRYPALAERVKKEWESNGAHRNANDPKRDTAVISSDNSAPFAEIVAIIDAVNTPQREWKNGDAVEKIPAFNVTFAVN